MELDHIVHFVQKNPKETVTDWQAQGLPASLGGQHINWGTQNVLLYLKDCYIEWLSVEKQEIATEAEHPLTRLLLHDQIGFGTICVRTQNIMELNRDLQERGIETTGVLDAERRTEDGELIKWKMLFVNESVSMKLPTPFFIEWQETDEQRYKKLRDKGVVQATNEALTIDRCVFGVWNPKEVEHTWRKILGGSLKLTNCRIEFRKTTETQERLEEVYFTNGTNKLEFEQGLYWLPPLSLGGR
ncbi:VOC family protein [Planococcus halocryophilus]|uniref:VOC family protein n=1 Tax=Planococcus halocryophilus TaxID=1215089 RepID=UPI001F0F55E6|nr:VOC family protein [Planococcus halocryophilus]MCH4826529.1 VOC family protein [Planococcus halocryophilus]